MSSFNTSYLQVSALPAQSQPWLAMRGFAKQPPSSEIPMDHVRTLPAAMHRGCMLAHIHPRIS